MAACGPLKPPCPPPSSGNIVYVVSQGWHTELALPVNELDGDLRSLSDIFPGARVLLIGYGKKTFMTAPAQTFSEYMLGPVPGPAVIHVVGLSVLPREAYPQADIISLSLPGDSKRALSANIWDDLLKDDSGKPKIVTRSKDPDGLFYAARSQYNLFHTCNTWTTDMLERPGLPLSSSHIVFSAQTMARVSETAANHCP